MSLFSLGFRARSRQENLEPVGAWLNIGEEETALRLPSEKNAQDLPSAQKAYAASVVIVMATLQGERFLEKQLRSFAAQTHRNWRLYVSDDGSTDGTREIVRNFAAEFADNRVLPLVDGPCRGFVANFLTAVCEAPEADHYAFSDQDDIWEADKLERALTILKSVPVAKPALYCSRTRIIDKTGRPLGMSPVFPKPLTFSNALVQSIAGGNTMVMNHAARALLVAAGPGLNIVSHDWWTYQLVTGAGGFVHYDHVPTVLYRRHDNNLVGPNNGLFDRVMRIHLLLQGRFKEWTERNISALNTMRHLLTLENRALLDEFARIRSQSLTTRFEVLRRTSIYRQTSAGNIGLIAAIVLNRV